MSGDDSKGGGGSSGFDSSSYGDYAPPGLAALDTTETPTFTPPPADTSLSDPSAWATPAPSWDLPTTPDTGGFDPNMGVPSFDSGGGSDPNSYLAAINPAVGAPPDLIPTSSTLWANSPAPPSGGSAGEPSWADDPGNSAPAGGGVVDPFLSVPSGGGVVGPSLSIPGGGEGDTPLNDLPPPSWYTNAMSASDQLGPAGASAAPNVGAITQAANSSVAPMVAGAGVSAGGGLPGMPTGPQDLASTWYDPNNPNAWQQGQAGPGAWAGAPSPQNPAGGGTVDPAANAPTAADPNADAIPVNATSTTGVPGTLAGLPAATTALGTAPPLTAPNMARVADDGSRVGTSAAGGADPSGWAKSMGITNPVGTALAAGAMGYNFMQQKKLNDSIGTPTADLARLAKETAATNAGVTTTGMDMAKQASALAQENASNVQGAIAGVKGSAADVKGNAGAVTGNAASLADQAAALTPVAQQLQTGGINKVNTSADALMQQATSLDPNAATLINKGTNLTSYIGTGTLPPEMQAQVTQAANDAKTARIAFYASRGMPTNPNQNTSLRLDLERIDRDSVVMAGTLAQQLASTGTGIVGAGAGLSGQAGGFRTSVGTLGAGQTGAGITAAGAAGDLTKGAGGLNTAAGNLNTAAGGLEQAGGGLDVAAGNLNNATGNLGTNLVNSGLQATGLQSTMYAQLAKIDADQQARTQQAIAAMAAALSGAPKTIQIPVG